MSMFKNFLRNTYFSLLDATYNIGMPWFLVPLPKLRLPRSRFYQTDFIYTLLSTISNKLDLPNGLKSVVFFKVK